MLDRHAVQELLRAGVKPRAVAQQFRVSRRTIERIAGEEKIRSATDGILRRDGSEGERVVGRPRVTEAIRARVQALVLEDPDRPPGEICRLLKEDGTPLGLSTVYRVLAAVRATIPATLQVRFEGVAGEFAQFDFGEVSVRLADGSRRTVHFAAYRLKYSRWMHVVLVPNERVEALIRSLLDSFEASGGVPLRVVFDNPKTVVVRHEDDGPSGMPCLRRSRSTTASRSSCARPASRSRKARSRISLASSSGPSSARGASPISRPICHSNSRSGSSR